MPPPTACSPQADRRLLYVMIVNTLHSVRFYFINTTVVYDFTALLKFTYIIGLHADFDCSVSFCTVLLTVEIILYKTDSYLKWPINAEDLIGDYRLSGDGATRFILMKN